VLKYLTCYILKQWSLVEFLLLLLFIITTLIIVMMMMAYDSDNINCQLIPESYMWIIHCTVQWWRLIRSCLIFPPQEDNIYQYLRAFPDKCKAESNLGMAVQVFLFFILFWQKRYHHRTKARFTFTVSLNL
jgi:hypothetical protein